MATNKKNSTNQNNKNKSSVKKKAITITKEPKKALPTPAKKTNKPVVAPKTNKAIGIVKENKTKKKNNKKVGKVINTILSIFMVLGISIMIIIMVFCGYIVINAPAFNTDLLYNKEASIFYDKNGNEILRAGAEQRELKTYEDLPQVLVDAIVATEDSRYFQHNGFDVVRFVKASFGQLVGQAGAGGASTLTMQVVKNTFTSKEASGFEGIVRKFTDIYMSIFLVERNYTKEEIMEFYVNAPFLGQNTYGVEQASQKYFGKSVSDLTLAEASLMAGIFNAPSSYNPFYSVELAEQRRATVLNLMVRHEYITEEQAADAKAISIESLLTESTKGSLNKYQPFIDIVADEVKDKTGYDPYEVPMLVYTTMDPDIQDVMYDLNEGNLGYKWKTYKYNDWKDVNDIGAVVTDVHDGSIAAVNGGRHQTVARGWSNAVDMIRNPGSTAKPIFAYGPYLEYNNGNTGTLFYDNPMTYSNGQALKNSDGKYLGAITMRYALIRSRNIPAIQAFQQVDKNKIAEFVHNLGIDYCQYGNGRSQAPTDCNLYESYAIGGGIDLSPKDMAGAYGAFARGGYYIEPYSFTKVIFRETDEPYEYKPEKTQAMSKETAYMITDMLVSAAEAGVGGKINIKGTEVAAKTGTSTFDAAYMKNNKIPDSASMDNWVITYSPDYVISFWYGVEKAGPKVYTDAYNADTQRKLISAILAKNIYKENSKFTKPDEVVSAKYEVESFPAQLPSEYTPGGLISTELFKKGTEPSEISDRFSQLQNPSNGSADVSGNVISLSWNGISTPNAINETYLQGFFNENYGQFASMYLNKRYTYNSKNIGTLGYQVYLQTDSGLQSLGFTSNPYFTYTAPSSGNYNFVIKSAYSIFKSNMSSGLNINVDLSLGEIPELPGDNEQDPEPTEPTE